MKQIFQASMVVLAGLVAMVVGGLAVVSAAVIGLIGLALAGVWAMLTGRRPWWTQLRQVYEARKGMQGAWNAGAAFRGAAEPETPPRDDEATARTTPFTRRRFGRAAGRVDVTDVTPRNVHS